MGNDAAIWISWLFHRPRGNVIKAPPLSMDEKLIAILGGFLHAHGVKFPLRSSEGVGDSLVLTDATGKVFALTVIKSLPDLEPGQIPKHDNFNN